MKKLSLGKLTIKDEEMLQREQLKTVFGGSGSIPMNSYKCCNIVGSQGRCSECRRTNQLCTEGWTVACSFSA